MRSTRQTFIGPLHRLAQWLGAALHLQAAHRKRLCRFAQSLEHGGGTMVGVEFLSRGLFRVDSPTFWLVGVVLVATIYLFTDMDIG